MYKLITAHDGNVELNFLGAMHHFQCTNRHLLSIGIGEFVHELDSTKFA